MDPEVPGDVLDPHVRSALARGTHDVFAKLFGIAPGHCDILPAGEWPSDQHGLQPARPPPLWFGYCLVAPGIATP
jgi:hypothetical protein